MWAMLRDVCNDAMRYEPNRLCGFSRGTDGRVGSADRSNVDSPPPLSSTPRTTSKHVSLYTVVKRGSFDREEGGGVRVTATSLFNSFSYLFIF